MFDKKIAIFSILVTITNHYTDLCINIVLFFKNGSKLFIKKKKKIILLGLFTLLY
jgi:hypothetical protein